MLFLQVRKLRTKSKCSSCNNTRVPHGYTTISCADDAASNIMVLPWQQGETFNTTAFFACPGNREGCVQGHWLCLSNAFWCIVVWSALTDFLLSLEASLLMLRKRSLIVHMWMFANAGCFWNHEASNEKPEVYLGSLLIAFPFCLLAAPLRAI